MLLVTYISPCPLRTFHTSMAIVNANVSPFFHLSKLSPLDLHSYRPELFLFVLGHMILIRTKVIFFLHGLFIFYFLIRLYGKIFFLHSLFIYFIFYQTLCCVSTGSPLPHPVRAFNSFSSFTVNAAVIFYFPHE